MEPLEDVLRKVDDLREDLSADTEKREAARAELQQIYVSSEWYSVRYAAGMALSVDRQSLQKEVNVWIVKLKENLNATIKEPIYETSGHYEIRKEYEGDFYEDWVWDGDALVGHKDVPDKTERMKAVKDAGRLFKLSGCSSLRELLRSTYKDNVRAVKLEAGKELGYSKLRVWLGEVILE